MAYKSGNGTNTTSTGSTKETTITLKWFQNLQFGLRSRRTEMANRRNIGNISRVQHRDWVREGVLKPLLMISFPVRPWKHSYDTKTTGQKQYHSPDLPTSHYFFLSHFIEATIACQRHHFYGHHFLRYIFTQFFKKNSEYPNCFRNYYHRLNLVLLFLW